MYCEHCGKKNNDTAKFCSGCGQALAQGSVPVVVPESPVVAPVAQPAAPVATSEKPKRNILLLVLVVLAVVVGAVLMGVFGKQADAPIDAPTDAPTDAPADSTVATILTWQEQYDLGVRYLEDGNYEEAIIAFTAAITLEAKQSAPYIGLAEVYIAQNDFDAAIAILQQGLQVLPEDAALTEKLAELESGNITDYWGNTRKTSYFDAEGNLVWYHIYDYDGTQQTLVTSYDATGAQTSQVEALYNEDGKMIQSYYFYSESGLFGKITYERNEDGQVSKANHFSQETGEIDQYTLYFYDEAGEEIEQQQYDSDGTLTSIKRTETMADGTRYLYYYSAEGALTGYQVWTYNENGRTDTCSVYNNNDVLQWQKVYAYDEDGNLQSITEYDADGAVTSVQRYE